MTADNKDLSNTAKFAELRLFFIGDQVGESIVVHFADGSKDGAWGVIDCCATGAPNATQNATLQFLSAQDVEHLAFVAISHLHKDHYGGMLQILGKFGADERRPVLLWKGPAEGRELRVYSRLQRLAHETIESALRRYETLNPKGRAPNSHGGDEELSELESLVAVIGGQSDYRVLPREGAAGYRFLPDALAPETEGTLTVVAFGPSHRTVQRWKRRLGVGAGDLVELAGLDDLIDDMSLTLFLSFGASRILLAGDLRDFAWEEIITERREAIAGEDVPSLLCHLVKAAHHGSRHAAGIGVDSTDLWREFLGSKEPENAPHVVIVSRHGEAHPHRVVLDYLRSQGRARACFVTNRAEGVASTPRLISMFRRLRRPGWEAWSRYLESRFSAYPCRLPVAVPGICEAAFTPPDEDPKMTCIEPAQQLW